MRWESKRLLSLLGGARGFQWWRARDLGLLQVCRPWCFAQPWVLFFVAMHSMQLFFMLRIMV